MCKSGISESLISLTVLQRGGWCERFKSLISNMMDVSISLLWNTQQNVGGCMSCTKMHIESHIELITASCFYVHNLLKHNCSSFVDVLGNQEWFIRVQTLELSYCPPPTWRLQYEKNNISDASSNVPVFHLHYHSVTHLSGSPIYMGNFSFPSQPPLLLSLIISSH